MAAETGALLGSTQHHCRVWTFLKGGDELTVEHSVETDKVMVTVIRAKESGEETAAVHQFPTNAAAEEFQASLEVSLLRFGWVFIGFLPNRRRRDHRRSQADRGDRRRWWTDGGTFLE